MKFLKIISLLSVIGLVSACGHLKPNGSNDSVYFASGSAALDRNARATIKQIAAEALNRQQFISGRDIRVADRTRHLVRLAGHTDSTGNKAANKRLSKKRVKMVKKALIKRGVPKDAIKTSAHGEKRQKVSTKDGVSESKNRRVDITILR